MTIWVVPGASRTGIVGEHGDALKVRVSAPPEGGRANDGAVELIHRLTGRRARLERGSTGRRKVVRIEGCSEQHALEALARPSG